MVATKEYLMMTIYSCFLKITTKGVYKRGHLLTNIEHDLLRWDAQPANRRGNDPRDLSISYPYPNQNERSPRKINLRIQNVFFRQSSMERRRLAPID